MSDKLQDLELEAKHHASFFKLLMMNCTDGEELKSATDLIMGYSKVDMSEFVVKRWSKGMAFEDLKHRRWDTLVDTTFAKIFEYMPGEPGVGQCISILSSLTQKLLRSSTLGKAGQSFHSVVCSVWSFLLLLLIWR